jgi:hypothetical protein
VFGDAIDYPRVRIVRRKWAFFQPRHVVMAPRGSIHFHPAGSLYRDDFASARLGDQGLFIHEMTHVWQHQKGVCLPLARYGIEQQAEIVRHAFLLRAGAIVPGAPPAEQYESVLPFRP